jgi:patatin-like phospholipase/acyl hydrolase
MKKILVLDGGGARGMVQASALAVLESHVGPLHEYFDLIIGSSIGSIVGGAIASGKIDCESVKYEMRSVLPLVFKKRFGMFIRKAKYKKDPLFEAAARMFGGSLKMCECRTKFIGTSVNDMDGRVHFFKSWEEKDGVLSVVDVMNRSSAAPVYFGAVPDEKTPAVWIDGGVGLNNNPAFFSFIEAVRQGWDSEKVLCVNVGTGYVPHSRSYEDALNGGILNQAFNFMKGGGYAHRGAERIIARGMNQLDEVVAEWFSYERFDIVLPEEMYKMDAVNYLDDYILYGRKIGFEMIKRLDEV